MPSKDRPRILIVRLGPIGDAILTTPLACALRRHYPNAFIGWVAGRQASALLRDHPALDCLIELKDDWNHSIPSNAQHRAQLRSHGFQISIDCQGTFFSSLVARISGSKRRIGLSSPCSSTASRLLNNHFVTPVFPHVVDRTLELATPLGIHSPRVEWQLNLSTRARSWATGWRRSIKSSAVTVLNPGGTARSKLWEPSRFAATARYLHDRYGHACVAIWRTSEERLMAEQIVDQSTGAALMAPVTDLQHLGALIETANLYISGDTGPLHLAVALGVPSIGLYGGTNAKVSGPYGQTFIQNAYHGPRTITNDAMKAIDVGQVCTVVDDLIASQTIDCGKRRAA